MNDIDWQKWMEEHHVRLRGNTNDGRSNEERSGGDISSVDKVEVAAKSDARSSGNSHIQEPKRKR